MTGVRRSRAACLAAALSVVLSFGSGSPAQAGAPVTDGFLCNYGEPFDGSRQEGTRLLQVYGGPVLLTEADGVTPARGTLVCRVVMSAYPYPSYPTHTYAGTDVAGRGTGVLAAGPAVVRVAGDESWDIALCTRFVNDGDGVTYYWNDDLSEWSTSPTVRCYLDVDPIEDPTDLGPTFDSVICPILALLFPPEGDVQGIWDCPPYGNLEPLPDLVPDVGPLPLGCDDGLDNDADGRTDYPADPGCASPSDTDEHSFAACDDGADNDGDRAADYPRDPGCASATDTDERGTTACDDGLDNDGDGSRDYVLDPGCDSPGDTSETDAALACDNGLDDDGDTFADYPRDTGCDSRTDPSERTIP